MMLNGAEFTSLYLSVRSSSHPHEMWEVYFYVIYILKHANLKTGETGELVARIDFMEKRT